jgi:ATP-dependent helicase HrpB
LIFFIVFFHFFTFFFVFLFFSFFSFLVLVVSLLYCGSRHALDYAAPNGPLLSVRVQELYGLSQHPTLARGRAPLTLELLSPAHRPIQTTRDLPSFWAGSWNDVKKEMKGRYPRHPWPDDPATAPPTTRAKPRG